MIMQLDLYLVGFSVKLNFLYCACVAIQVTVERHLVSDHVFVLYDHVFCITNQATKL